MGRSTGAHVGEFPNGAEPYAEVVTEAEIAGYAAEGDSVSFHGWDGTATSTMSVDDVRRDTAQAIKWLQSRGYEGRMWRAAWVQDSAANHTVINDMVVAQAMSSTQSPLMACWPPIDPMNIPRWPLYGQSGAQIDAMFTLLQQTRWLFVAYNHGVGTGYAYDATQAGFDHFVSKITAAQSAGWLEAVTFEQLWYEAGGQFAVVRGDPVSQYTGPDGVLTTRPAL